MRALPVAVIAERARPFFEARGCVLNERYHGAVAALRERHRTLVELAEAGAFFFVPDDQLVRDPAAVATLVVPSRPLLAALVTLLDTLPDWSEPALDAEQEQRRC